MKYLFNCLMIVGFFASVVVNINTLAEVNYLRKNAQSLEGYFDNQMRTHSEFADATYDDVKELKSKVELNSKLLDLSYREFKKLHDNVNDRFEKVAEMLIYSSM